MGADLLIAWVDLRDGTSEMIEELFRIWEHKLRNVCPANIDFENQFADYFYDEDGDRYETEMTMQAIRHVLREDMVNLRDGIANKLNTAFTMTPPRSEYEGCPTRLLLCGGTSWGDSPSDLFDGINRLYDASILDLTVTEEIVLAYRLFGRREEAIQLI